MVEACISPEWLVIAVLCVSVCSYLLLISQYESISFCDAVFASYVLLPLQQTHGVLLRKTVWGEHLTVLQSLSIPANQVTVLSTDLHIYNLDAVPPIHVISNHVDITSLPLQMADRLRRVQPVAVANHIKVRQSPIERAVT